MHKDSGRATGRRVDPWSSISASIAQPQPLVPERRLQAQQACHAGDQGKSSPVAPSRVLLRHWISFGIGGTVRSNGTDDTIAPAETDCRKLGVPEAALAEQSAEETASLNRRRELLMFSRRYWAATTE